MWSSFIPRDQLTRWLDYFGMHRCKVIKSGMSYSYNSIIWLLLKSFFLRRFSSVISVYWIAALRPMSYHPPPRSFLRKRVSSASTIDWAKSNLCAEVQFRNMAKFATTRRLNKVFPKWQRAVLLCEQRTSLLDGSSIDGMFNVIRMRSLCLPWILFVSESPSVMLSSLVVECDKRWQCEALYFCLTEIVFLRMRFW